MKAFVAFAILALGGRAIGSSCGPQTLEDQIAKVDTIVYAILVEARIDDEEFHQASATFRLQEVLKGTIDHEFVLTTSADLGSVRSVGLLVGARYLLFFNSDSMSIGQCSGSGQASGNRVDEVKRKI